jgi:uncharacterized protein YifN (PemK superfamily)
VTWQALKGLIVKKLGPIAEKVIGVIEKTFGFVVTLITKGPLALLDMAKDFLGELKTMFFDSLIEWVKNTIIVKAVQKLISMFNPVGAIIQAIITIYNTIQFFIERAKQIATFVSAVFNSIAEIAAGSLGKAITAVVNALAKGLPVAISFLANLIGLGGIAKKIQEIIKKIRKPIDKVIGKVVGFVVDKAKKIWAGMKNAGKKVVKGVKDKVSAWWNIRKSFTNAGGKKHTLFFQSSGPGAKLMIASDLKSIKEYLQSDAVNSQPENKPILEKVNEIIREIDALKAKPSEKDQQNIETKMEEVEGLLKLIKEPLNENSIIIDSNAAIALVKKINGKPLQPGEEAIIRRLSKMGPIELRLTDTTIAEVKDNGKIIFKGVPLSVVRNSDEYQALYKVLVEQNVGREKGEADRQIVADAFFADVLIGVTPRLATHDTGVYNHLLIIAGKHPAKLGKPTPELFPNGFDVTINGRTIKVIPLPKK